MCVAPYSVSLVRFLLLSLFSSFCTTENACSAWLFNWKQRGICKIFLSTQPHENSINVYERTVILRGNRCIGSNLRKRALTQIKNHFWLVTDLSWLLKGYSTDMVIIFTKFSVLYGVTFEIYSRASFIY